MIKNLDVFTNLKNLPWQKFLYWRGWCVWGKEDVW